MLRDKHAETADDAAVIKEAKEEDRQMRATIPTAEKLVALIGVLRLNGIVTQGLKLDVYSHGAECSVELDLTRDIDEIVEEIRLLIERARDFAKIDRHLHQYTSMSNHAGAMQSGMQNSIQYIQQRQRQLINAQVGWSYPQDASMSPPQFAATHPNPSGKPS